MNLGRTQGASAIEINHHHRQCAGGHFFSVADRLPLFQQSDSGADSGLRYPTHHFHYCLRQMTLNNQSFRLLAIIVLTALVSACALGPPEGITSVRGFDLNRYVGVWYEIARLDHRFERGMSDVSATYRAQDDGGVEVINRGFDPAKGAWREAIGNAQFISDPSHGSLRVSFFGPFYGGYHIVALDPDYRWSLVLGPDRSYAWILAREKTLTPAVRTQIEQKALAAGIDTAALIWVQHSRQDPVHGKR
jgi:apolipoprotein D and lipocalin family protein